MQSKALRQNQNLQANSQIDRFAKSGEMGKSFSSFQTNGLESMGSNPVGKTTASDRVTAPGFAQMFENFCQGS